MKLPVQQLLFKKKQKNIANLSICCMAHFNSISPIFYCNYKCIKSVVVAYTKDSFSFTLAYRLFVDLCCIEV